MTELSRMLSADLIGYFRHPNDSYVVVRWKGITWKTVSADGIEQERGDGDCEVVEVLRSPVLRSGTTIPIPAQRAKDPAIRDRNTINQWNNLELKPGQMLLLVCRPNEDTNAWHGLAAVAVESAKDPKVEAARECLRIEHAASPDDRKAGLEKALVATDPLLRFYALDVLGERSIFGRETGANLVDHALASGKLNAEHKANYGAKLVRTGFFDSTKGADAANKTIVAALAREFLKADDDHKMSWALYLGNAVRPSFSDDKDRNREIRTTLVRAARVDGNAMVSALATLQIRAKKDEFAILDDVLQIWRSAQ